MTRGLFSAALLVPALAACASSDRTLNPVSTPHAIVEAPVAPVPTWRSIATVQDGVRIDGLTPALRRARAAVPARLNALLKEEGALVDADAAQPMPQLSPGSYYCRLIRFGGRSRFQSFTPDFCYVALSERGLAFTKQTGSNRPEGYIHPDGDKREIFLGTTRTAGEKGGLTYGKDAASDQVGIVERVGPFRWRLVLARAGRGATLDMYELVPVPTAVSGAEPAVQPD